MTSDDAPEGGWGSAAHDAVAAGLASLAASVVGPDPVLVTGTAMAAPLVVQALSKLVDAATGHRWRNAGRVLELAAGDDHTPTGLVELVANDPKRTMIVVDAVEAATRTALDQKVAALGRLLRSGVLGSDDAEIDLASLSIRALADLEAPHLDVLRLMRDCQLNGGHVVEYGYPMEWSQSHIATARPGYAAAVGPIVQTLVRHGLVEAYERPDMSLLSTSSTGFASRPPPATWKITVYGEHILELVMGAPERSDSEEPG